MKEDIREIAEQIAKNIKINTKEVLTSDEAAEYMGMSKSYLYKLTMCKQIPHYKPTGKMVYFNRKEIETWLQTNRVPAEENIASTVAAWSKK